MHETVIRRPTIVSGLKRFKTFFDRKYKENVPKNV